MFKRNRWHILTYAFIALLFVAGLSWAAATTFYGQVTVQGTADDTTLLDVQNSSGTSLFKITTTAVTREIQLPLTSFISSNGATAIPLSASTAPGLEIDDSLPNIVWADGETTPARVSFRIPEDYSSTGVFKVWATESGATTSAQVNFSMYINNDNETIDSTAGSQTAVSVNSLGSTPQEVTLTPSTDASSITAGALVTLNIWRDDTATGTNDLEVKGVSFYYTASH